MLITCIHLHVSNCMSIEILLFQTLHNELGDLVDCTGRDVHTDNRLTDNRKR